MLMKDKVVVITGAGSGIGRVTSLLLAQEGGKIVGIDINRNGLENTCGLVRKQGGTMLPLTGDISSKAEVEALIRKTVETYGRIDILVNNAGIAPGTKYMNITEQEWDKVMAVNLKGPFFCIKTIAPFMIEQKSGKIVNVSSVTAKAGAASAGIHYVASKAAIIALTICFAKLLAPYGINVNSVAPGPTNTELVQSFSPEEQEAMKKSIPLKRFAEPLDIAQGILFLAGPNSNFITGEILDVNGGLYMD